MSLLPVMSYIFMVTKEWNFLFEDLKHYDYAYIV